jgi:hypothetical protein
VIKKTCNRDDERSWYPITSRTDPNVEKVTEMTRNSCCLTFWKINEISMNTKTVKLSITEDLNKKKFCLCQNHTEILGGQICLELLARGRTHHLKKKSDW